MQYIKDVKTIISLLTKIAADGMMSEPERVFYSFQGYESLYYYSQMSEEVRKEIRAFMAKYISVLSEIDYPLYDPFTNKETRTSSLLGMLNHMTSSGRTHAEYVADNAKRLKDSLETHANLYEEVELLNIVK